MTNEQFIHYIEIFVGAFLTFVASSGLNWFDLPSDSDLKKVALAGIVAGVVAVYQQIAKPAVKLVASKI